MYNLIIVESPAKAKTIESYLGKNYVVKSSIGHIRDLTKTGPSGLGINVDDEFKASYGYITGKKKVVTELKKLALNANKVYIATDPDREGEAIGWHLADEIGFILVR
jgi:DNA topoisomerase-1